MRARWILGLNLLLAACVALAAIPAVPGTLRMLASGLVVLVLPGVGWLGLFRRVPLSPAKLALAVTGMSTLCTLGALLVTAAPSGPPSRGLAVAWTALFLNVGLVWKGPPGRLQEGIRWRLLAGVAAVGFLVSSLFGLYVVPALEDHDMELAGTAWGIAQDWKPYMLTNRELYIQAAHPVLFHFHVAESLLLTGEIAATKPHYDAARRAEEAEANHAPIAWDTWWRADYDAMMAHPALVGTRAASCTFSALGLALLAHLAMVFTGRAWAGVAAAGLFLSFPESLVRTCYAGYFPPTFFISAAAVLLLVEQAGWPWIAAAGALAATLNHKTVVVVLAVTALAGLDLLRTRFRVWDRGAIALGVGFGAGTLVWWTYGLSVNAHAFIQDHLRKHLVHRALFHDFRLGASPERYAPGMAEVWLEFNAHTGYLFVPLAVLALAFWFVQREDGPGLATSLPELLGAWFLTGAVLYTLTDWRQTKHLMNQLTPMVVAAIALLEPRAPRWLRGLAAACLVVILGFNLATDARLIRDFKSFRISGSSDIDHW